MPLELLLLVCGAWDILLLERPRLTAEDDVAATTRTIEGWDARMATKERELWSLSPMTSAIAGVER